VDETGYLNEITFGNPEVRPLEDLGTERRKIFRIQTVYV
jgi:hypothetical protein